MMSQLAMLQEMDLRDREMMMREGADRRAAELHPYQLADEQWKPEYYQGMLKDRQYDTMLQYMDWMNKQRSTNPNYEALVNGLDILEGIPQDAFMPQMSNQQILEILAQNRSKQPISDEAIMKLQQTNTPAALHALSQIRRK